MDDRKKQIGELEKFKKSNQASLNVLLEGLGKTLLNRPEISGEDNKNFSDPVLCQDIDKYRQLQKEIVDSEASIQDVEIQIARLRELEEDIESREQELTAQAKKQSDYYAQLGKLVLEDPGLDDFSSPYRMQADTLVPKIKSLEERLGDLTNPGGGGNVFSWIGKSAQSMVLRSFLTKSLDSLERLYRNTGEQFFRYKTENPSVEKTLGIEIIDVGNEIEKSKGRSADMTEELGKFREERRLIDDQFNASGGALKQIQGLKKTISTAQDNLKTLYLHFGIIVAGDGQKQEKPASSKKRNANFTSLITESDQKILDEILRLRQSIQEDEAAIEKLTASLAIDEEWETIEKFRRSIDDKKARIAEAEQNIAELESRIKSSEMHIEELKKLL